MRQVTLPSWLTEPRFESLLKRVEFVLHDRSVLRRVDPQTVMHLVGWPTQRSRLLKTSSRRCVLSMEAVA